jgi:hypothetical protein
MTSSRRTLTIDEADELILAISTKEDGAIEDCEVEQDSCTYHFETGAVGTVSRLTGESSMQRTIKFNARCSDDGCYCGTRFYCAAEKIVYLDGKESPSSFISKSTMRRSFSSL